MIEKSTLLTLSLLGVASATLQAQQSRPNVLIIFTDDQGYNDLGCFGSTTHKTPVLDRLHSEGSSFSSFYAQPVSGSSRSALMTGRYPIRSKGREMAPEEFTMAEMFKEVGYQTVCIGKWDLTTKRQPIIEQMANAQGFDYYYGALGANDGGVIKLYENSEFLGDDRDMSSLIRRYTDKCIDFLESGREEDKPFLLYLSHTMMHVQIDASPEFKGKSEGGLYGDVVEEFDYHTGRLLDVLKREGLEDNTIVIYTTDNGPWCQTKYIERHRKNAPKYQDEIFWGDLGVLRAGKGSAYEGGSRVRCIMKWPEHIPTDRECDELISTLDFMPTFASIIGYELNKETRMDGVNQSDMILSKRGKSARTTFCYCQDNETDRFVAIRDTRWKLLLPDRAKTSVYLMDFGTNDYELYDLKNDISERVNLVDKYPKIVERLKVELEKNL